jgi:hypothetical protein
VPVEGGRIISILEILPREISELINVSRETASLLARDEQMSSRDIEEEELLVTF